jgi:hypothetical protein
VLVLVLVLVSVLVLLVSVLVFESLFKEAELCEKCLQKDSIEVIIQLRKNWRFFDFVSFSIKLFVNSGPSEIIFCWLSTLLIG